MPFHDAVLVKCENGAITEVKALVPSIWAETRILDDCVFSNLTLLPFLDGGMLLLYIILYFIIFLFHFHSMFV